MLRHWMLIVLLMVVGSILPPELQSNAVVSSNDHGEPTQPMLNLLPSAFVEGTWNNNISLPEVSIDSMTVANGLVYIFSSLGGATHLLSWNPQSQQWTIHQPNTSSDQWSKLQTGRDGQLYSLHTIYGSTGTRPQWRIARYNGSAWVDVTTSVPFPTYNFDSYVALSSTELYMIDNDRLLAIWNGTVWTTMFAHDDNQLYINGINRLHYCGDALYFVYVEVMQVNEHVVTVLEELRKFSPATGTFSTGGGLNRMAICEGNNRYSFGGPKIKFETENAPTRMFTTSFDGSPSSGSVRAMIRIGGYIYVTGNFEMIDGVQTGKVARWNGSRWEGLGPEFSRYRNAPEHIVGLGHQIYLAGPFSGPGSIDAPNITTWTPTLPYTLYNPLVSNKP